MVCAHVRAGAELYVCVRKMFVCVPPIAPPWSGLHVQS